jgi:hypothetical protein
MWIDYEKQFEKKMVPFKEDVKGQCLVSMEALEGLVATLCIGTPGPGH